MEKKENNEKKIVKKYPIVPVVATPEAGLTNGHTRSEFLRKWYKVICTVLSVCLVALIFLIYEIIMIDKFYPLTSVGNINISFLTKRQADDVLTTTWQKRSQDTISFNYQNGSDSAKQYFVDISSLNSHVDYSVIDDIFKKQHSSNILRNLFEQVQNIFNKDIINAGVTLNLTDISTKIDKEISRKAVSAILTYTESETPQGSPSADINIQEGVFGIRLNPSILESEIKSYINIGKYNNSLPYETIKPDQTTEDLTKTKNTLEYLSKHPLTLSFQDKTWQIDSKQLITMLNLTKGNSLIDKNKVFQYLDKLSSDIDQKVIEGQFEFDANSKKVAVFKPSQEGRKLNQEKTYDLLIIALENQNGNIDLPVEIVGPKVQTADVNNLGIKELLGRGISNFAGSIPNRIFNVGHTANKINGTLVAPGEVFSFNQTVGDISAATGFKQAYVIKSGRTVLDDGGGVCQDSTTLFRAVLNAGLPIVKRTAHAYRVGYYEQGFPPGLDATIFYPSVDFQFKNDTSAYILIQAYVLGLTLYVDLYGTPDGRIVNITKPIVTNITPAPPELRQDDPTLSKGQIKQVDWAANGATVRFRRTVEKDGQEILNETWTSLYKPWQAVYLVGTGS